MLKALVVPASRRGEGRSVLRSWGGLGPSTQGSLAGGCSSSIRSSAPAVLSCCMDGKGADVAPSNPLHEHLTVIGMLEAGAEQGQEVPVPRRGLSTVFLSPSIVWVIDWQKPFEYSFG